MHGTEEVLCQGQIGHLLFMGNHIVGNSYYARVLVPTHDAQNGAKAWAHKWCPEADYYNIGKLGTDTAAHRYPIGRINRVYDAGNANARWCRLICALRLAGEK